MTIPYELFVALRYLRFRGGGGFLSLITWIAVAGVAVGTAALVIALALNAGFVQDVRSRILSGSSHLTVMSSEESVFGRVDEIVRDTSRVPGVRAVCPVLFSPAMLTNEGLDAPGYRIAPTVPAAFGASRGALELPPLTRPEGHERPVAPRGLPHGDVHGQSHRGGRARLR